MHPQPARIAIQVNLKDKLRHATKSNVHSYAPEGSTGTWALGVRELRLRGPDKLAGMAYRVVLAWLQSKENTHLSPAQMTAPHVSKQNMLCFSLTVVFEQGVRLGLHWLHLGLIAFKVAIKISFGIGVLADGWATGCAQFKAEILDA